MHYYYPYFRGKQYELITIRENAKLLAESGFVPIIEPVKENTRSLDLAIKEMIRAGGECILIVNPKYGDHCPDSKAINKLIEKDFANFDKLSVGVLLNSSMSIQLIEDLCKKQSKRNVTLIHYGFENGRNLTEILPNHNNVKRHIFVEDFCGRLYRKHFDGKQRILLKDGFQRRINREYPDSEPFSDLHATFGDENMNGFGDFLIVGDDYSESGGPAYTVAIHLTYIDENKDEAMCIHHFKSDQTATQTNPAGKFTEALTKLVDEVQKDNSPILKSEAVKEFLSLHNSEHFPGLGYVKKLSMQHHIETLADYFKRKS